MLAPHLLLTLALAAGADERSPAGDARTYAATQGSTLRYHLIHPFHAVDGIARAVEAKARILGDGTADVAVRARVDAFDSGNSNRDAHMLEVTEAARLPYVQFTGTASGVRTDHYPAELEVPITGTLDFHGVTQQVSVTAKVRFASPERADVEVTFPVSLTAYGVKRPSVVFVAVRDRIEITARLALALAPP
jgi:polyisoprenoid-binding protein YceI